MLGDETNGNDDKIEEAKAAVEEKLPEQGTQAPKVNKADIKEGVMTVSLQLDNGDAAFAAAIGSLVLAQDMVKNYFAKKMISDQIMRERTTSRIIRPGMVN